MISVLIAGEGDGPHAGEGDGPHVLVSRPLARPPVSNLQPRPVSHQITVS